MDNQGTDLSWFNEAWEKGEREGKKMFALFMLFSVVVGAVIMAVSHFFSSEAGLITLLVIFLTAIPGVMFLGARK